MYHKVVFPYLRSPENVHGGLLRIVTSNLLSNVVNFIMLMIRTLLFLGGPCTRKMPASCYSYECLQIRSLPSRCHKTFCCCTAHYPKRRATVVDCIEELQQQTPPKSRDPPVCHHQCEELPDLQHCRNCSSMVLVTGVSQISYPDDSANEIFV